MRFIIFVIDKLNNPGNASESEMIDAFNDELQANSNWILAAGIADRTKGVVIDNREGAGHITEHSLFEGPEHYSGFWIIQTDTEHEARLLAAAGSLACNRRVELRPFLGN